MFRIIIAIILFLSSNTSASAWTKNNIESDLANLNYCLEIAASASVPRKIDRTRELASIICEEKQHLEHPTLAYTFIVSDSDMEKKLRNSAENYRTEIFKERCQNTIGAPNRFNYKSIYLNKNKRKISEIFISYYECVGAYDDEITNGLGTEFALRQLEKIIGDFEKYRSETKILLEYYQKLLSNAKLLLKKYQEAQASLESERLIRAIETLGNVGSPNWSSSSQNRSTDPICFLVKSWSSGINKNCVYNCMGSEATNTIGAAEICPLTMRK